MANRFEHLEERYNKRYDFSSTLFRKSLPSRYFSNNITYNFLLGCEKIFGYTAELMTKIYSRFRLD